MGKKGWSHLRATHTNKELHDQVTRMRVRMTVYLPMGVSRRGEVLLGLSRPAVRHAVA